MTTLKVEIIDMIENLYYWYAYSKMPKDVESRMNQLIEKIEKADIREGEYEQSED